LTPISSDTNLAIVNNESAESDPIDSLLKAYDELKIPLNAVPPLSIIDEVDWGSVNGNKV